MKEIFLVSTKTYYTDANGVDRQIEDGDQLPYVYLRADKAIKRARHISENYINLFGYEVAIRNLENPARKDRVLFAERLTKSSGNLRFEIRVYKDQIWE